MLKLQQIIKQNFQATKPAFNIIGNSTKQEQAQELRQ